MSSIKFELEDKRYAYFPQRFKEKEEAEDSNSSDSGELAEDLKDAYAVDYRWGVLNMKRK